MVFPLANLKQLSLTLILCASMLAGHALADSSSSPLFENTTPLELSLEVNFNTLCRPRETPECDYSPSTLGWSEGDRSGTIPVMIRVRGGWRSLSKHCQVPLLFVRFTAEDTVGTPFEGQESLPLTTHCGRTSITDDDGSSRKYLNLEQYLLKEYLAYRIFDEISDLSLRVRLVRMRYDKPDKTGKGNTYYAFFTEHFNSLAQRSGLELLERQQFDAEKINLARSDQVALFQFMIGNTDWSIVRQRNMILLADENGIQNPVPYDLDMSGLVNAPYAGPPPTLPIEEVTDRYYLGFCNPEPDWKGLFDAFMSERSVILKKTRSVPGLYTREKKSAESFLKRFFSILDSPKKRQDKIIEACQEWPPSLEDHMTPTEPSRKKRSKYPFYF